MEIRHEPVGIDVAEDLELLGELFGQYSMVLSRHIAESIPNGELNAVRQKRGELPSSRLQ